MIGLFFITESRADLFVSLKLYNVCRFDRAQLKFSDPRHTTIYVQETTTAL